MMLVEMVGKVVLACAMTSVLKICMTTWDTGDIQTSRTRALALSHTKTTRLKNHC
jgi:hypothetical protein